MTEGADLVPQASLAGAKKWRRYPAYKDSGIEWLGEIPEHWEVKRLKYICELNPPKSRIAHLPKDLTVSFLPMACVSENGKLNLEEIREIEDVWNGFTYFENNDVIVAKITPCFENGKGAYVQGLTNGIGFGSTEFHVLRHNFNSELRYLYYLTYSYSFRSLGKVEMYGAAGQQRVPDDFIKNFRVGVPPLPEQKTIADYLDRETAKIDALVATKERFIELLAEKRTALISQAVTKGLDPNVPLKDSGVEWLGEIPEHWEVKRLKHVARINSNTLTEGTEPGYVIKYIDIGNVSESGLLAEPEEMIFGNAPSRARRIIKKDNLIISTVRTYLKAIAHFPNPEMAITLAQKNLPLPAKMWYN